MKLSFSLPSKSKTSQKPPIPAPSAADQTPKEFVTEFDPSKTLTTAKPSYIIPPKQNEWRPYKKMKNIDLPLQSDPSRDLQFEADSSSHNADPDSKTAYGLILRNKDDNNNNNNNREADNKVPASAPVETFLLQSFKEDMKRLPDDQGFEEFEDVPVEGFGKALLYGYGWVEGKGIGKNSKEDVKVKQYERRGDKEGLGFSSKDLNNVKKKPDKEERMERINEVQDGFFVGKDVRVIEGKQMGSKGTITEKMLKHKGDERKSSKRSTESEKRSDRGVSWLRSHIRVRIVSKSLGGGKLYLKKGQVMDVVGPYTCDIAMDESKELVQGVEQELLETALPRRGGPVLVLYGRHKGVYGNLVERDLDREMGVVRDADSQELLDVKLEQIAEYTGDPSYLGY